MNAFIAKFIAEQRFGCALCRLVLVLAFLCCAGSTAFAAAMQPGFRTIGVWDEGKSLRLDLAIWYPATRVPVAVTYNDWTLTVSRGARPLPGPYPLVIFSHDTAGNRFVYHHLAEVLVRQGYVVVAPTHWGDNSEEMNRLFTAMQLRGRIDEVRATIDRILAEPDLAAVIDTKRIALIGFGTGATTALMLAGATLQQIPMQSYCANSVEDDPYCSQWVRPRIEAMLEDKALYAPYADSRIRSVIAVSPAYSMLVQAKSLRTVQADLLLLWAEKDSLNRKPAYMEGLRDSLPAGAVYGRLKGATLQDLMAPYTAAHSGSLHDEGALYTPAQRQRLHQELGSRFVEFLARMGRETPHAPEPEPTKESDKKKNKKQEDLEPDIEPATEILPQRDMHGPPQPLPKPPKSSGAATGRR